ncbi:hypothetical protein BJX65DRAFT_281118 [Aspergillus insuetus]
MDLLNWPGKATYLNIPLRQNIPPISPPVITVRIVSSEVFFAVWLYHWVVFSFSLTTLRSVSVADVAFVICSPALVVITITLVIKTDVRQLIRLHHRALAELPVGEGACADVAVEGNLAHFGEGYLL